MSQRSYASPLIIPVRPSRGLRLIFILFSLTATASIWLAELDRIVQIIFTLLLGLYAVGSWRALAALQGEPADLVWDSEGRWWLRGGGGERELQLLDESYVTVVLVVLRFAGLEGSKGFSLIFTPDNLDSETRRRLRVRLAITPAGKD